MESKTSGVALAGLKLGLIVIGTSLICLVLISHLFAPRHPSNEQQNLFATSSDGKLRMRLDGNQWVPANLVLEQDFPYGTPDGTLLMLRSADAPSSCKFIALAHSERLPPQEGASNISQKVIDMAGATNIIARSSLIVIQEICERDGRLSRVNLKQPFMALASNIDHHDDFDRYSLQAGDEVELSRIDMTSSYQKNLGDSCSNEKPLILLAQEPGGNYLFCRRGHWALIGMTNTGS
jgi:hypothetical protein